MVRKATAGSRISAAEFLPSGRDLDSLREAAKSCRGCELYENATQTVFGEGPARATMVLVGEQPGDKEDVEGLPFVGPAGGVLEKALIEAGITRGDTYVTNAVKHFRWKPAGKRRIHETPRASDIRACQPWLEAELDAIEPSLIVLMGSVAVRSLLGPDVRVLANRGHVIESAYGPCLVTVHPSSILRVEEPSQREPAFEAFVEDLKLGVVYLARAARV